MNAVHLAISYCVFVFFFFLELMPTINILIIIGITNKKLKNFIVLVCEDETSFDNITSRVSGATLSTIN